MQLRSNEFWGRRSGQRRSDGSLAFQQRQWRPVDAGRDGRNHPKRFHWPLRRTGIHGMGTGNSVLLYAALRKGTI